jgi:hypothetical protein
VSGTVSISARHVAATGAAPSDLTHTVKAICCRQTIASKLIKFVGLFSSTLKYFPFLSYFNHNTVYIYHPWSLSPIVVEALGASPR